MKASIITVNERLPMALKLKEELEAYGIPTIVLNDTERKGCTWNSVRAIRELIKISDTNEPMLFCTDDVILCKDFLNRFNELHNKAKQDIYSLAVRCKAGNQHGIYLTEQVKRDGFSVAVDGDDKAGYQFTDIGWVMFNKLEFVDIADRYMQYHESFDSKMPIFPRKGEKPSDLVKRFRRLGKWKHFDLDFSNFLEEIKQSFAVAVPGLTKHNLDVPSSLGHNFNNSAWSFIDEQTCRTQ